MTKTTTATAPQKSPQDNAAEIIDEFGFFDNWEERYRYLIDLGGKLAPFDEKYKTDENRLRGCQSLVHFRAEYAPPLLHFSATSDAAIVRGLIAILLRVYSGQRPADILAMPTDFLATIGLDEHLSATRKNGLSSFLEAIMSAAQNAQKQSS